MLTAVMVSDIMLSVVMLRVIYTECLPYWMSFMLSVANKPFYDEWRYADCRYAECRYAECHYAECRCAEYRYAECQYAELHLFWVSLCWVLFLLSADMLSVVMLSVIMLSVIMLSVIMLSIIYAEYHLCWVTLSWVWCRRLVYLWQRRKKFPTLAAVSKTAAAAKNVATSAAWSREWRRRQSCRTTRCQTYDHFTVVSYDSRKNKRLFIFIFGTLAISQWNSAI